jgi:beta-lactamase regulating signal transducer with metallopeptidase domain
MMLPQNMHEIVPVAVERVLDSLVGGTALCTVAWTWLRVARRQNSASRFLILFILLIGIALLPLFGLSWLARSGGSGTAETHSLITLPAGSAESLFIVWAAIALALLTRVAFGFVQFERLKNSCVAVDRASLDPQVRMALQGCTRAVELCVSDRVNVPTALGLAAPAKIVIPAWLMDQISPQELHHLVLHEAAHLRRWDDWTNFAQRVLGALFFFHPALWWLQGRISLEREMACDECVLAETGDARSYARSLANMAERSFARRTMALAQAAVSRLHDTTLRVARILSPATRKGHSPIGMIATAAAFGSISVAVALFSPDLVKFSQPAQPELLGAEAAPVPQHATVKVVPASLKVSASAPKQTLALAKPNRKTSPVAQVPPDREAMARVERPSLFLPVRATADQPATVTQPAMLVVYQEMVSSDGSVVVVERTYWHVVLHQSISHKEPARTT